jgi:hypothetical protein
MTSILKQGVATGPLGYRHNIHHCTLGILLDMHKRTYAATASPPAAALPLPFPGLLRPQATFAFLPSTSMPPCAARPSAVLSANCLVLKLTNAQSVISKIYTTGS